MQLLILTTDVHYMSTVHRGPCRLEWKVFNIECKCVFPYHRITIAWVSLKWFKMALQEFNSLPQIATLIIINCEFIPSEREVSKIPKLWGECTNSKRWKTMPKGSFRHLTKEYLGRSSTPEIFLNTRSVYLVFI